MTYKNWLQKKLRQLDETNEETDLNVYEGYRLIVTQAAERAALAGIPQAVKCCQIKSHLIGPDTVREILAECLSYISTDTLTVIEAASKLNISARKVYDLCEQGLIKHSTNPIRIKLTDLEAYQSTQRQRPNHALRHLK